MKKKKKQHQKEQKSEYEITINNQKNFLSNVINELETSNM
jgi:hypothetical protein